MERHLCLVSTAMTTFVQGCNLAANGTRGATGAVGVRGATGPSGITGPSGMVGATGAIGLFSGLVSDVLVFASGNGATGPTTFITNVSASAGVSQLLLIGYGSNLVTGTLPIPGASGVSLASYNDFSWNAPRMLTLTGLSATIQNGLVTGAYLEGDTFTIAAFVETAPGSDTFVPSGLNVNFTPFEINASGTITGAPGIVPVVVAPQVRVVIVGYWSIVGPQDTLHLGMDGVSVGLSFV